MMVVNVGFIFDICNIAIEFVKYFIQREKKGVYFEKGLTVLEL